MTCSGSIRLTRSVRRPPASAPITAATWAAGSVVVSSTGWPRRASSTAIPAAKVVFPTPPLPIVRTSPRPRSATWSTSSASETVPAPGAATISPTGPASCSGGPPNRSERNPSTPTGLHANSGTSSRTRPASSAGSAASASLARAASDTASGSAVAPAWNTPLTTRRWLAMPSAFSSRAARAASPSAKTSGRDTSTSTVWARSARVASAQRYRSRWLARPDSGPRHEVPTVLVLMNSSHARGSDSNLRVCPVGAVSNTTWS